jgi:hypothetical protein
VRKPPNGQSKEFSMKGFLANSQPAHDACNDGYVVRLLDADGEPTVTMYPGTIADYGRDERDEEIASLRDALEQAEACMSIVAPRWNVKEYRRILGVVRKALKRADK